MRRSIGAEMTLAPALPAAATAQDEATASDGDFLLGRHLYVHLRDDVPWAGDGGGLGRMRRWFVLGALVGFVAGVAAAASFIALDL